MSRPDTRRPVTPGLPGHRLIVDEPERCAANRLRAERNATGNILTRGGRGTERHESSGTAPVAGRATPDMGATCRRVSTPVGRADGGLFRHRARARAPGAVGLGHARRFPHLLGGRGVTYKFDSKLMVPLSLCAVKPVRPAASPRSLADLDKPSGEAVLPGIKVAALPRLAMERLRRGSVRARSCTLQRIGGSPWISMGIR